MRHSLKGQWEFGEWGPGLGLHPAAGLYPGKATHADICLHCRGDAVTHVEPGVDSRLSPRQPVCAVRRVVWTLGKSVAFRDMACFSPHIDFEAYYSDLQEAVPPRGRQPADCESVTVTSSWGSIRTPV